MIGEGERGRGKERDREREREEREYNTCQPCAHYVHVTLELTLPYTRCKYHVTKNSLLTFLLTVVCQMTYTGIPTMFHRASLVMRHVILYHSSVLSTGRRFDVTVY